MKIRLEHEDRDNPVAWAIYAALTKMANPEFKALTSEYHQIGELDVTFTINGHEMDVRHVLDRLADIHESAVKRAAIQLLEDTCQEIYSRLESLKDAVGRKLGCED